MHASENLSHNLHSNIYVSNVFHLVAVLTWERFKHFLSLHSYFLPYSNINLILFWIRKRKTRPSLDNKAFLNSSFNTENASCAGGSKANSLWGPSACKWGDLYPDYVQRHLNLGRERDSQHPSFELPEESPISSAERLPVPLVIQQRVNVSPTFGKDRRLRRNNILSVRACLVANLMYNLWIAFFKSSPWVGILTIRVL